MDDLIIDGDAAGALEAIQVIEGRITTVLLDKFLDLVIDVPSRDAGAGSTCPRRHAPIAVSRPALRIRSIFDGGERQAVAP